MPDEAAAAGIAEQGKNVVKSFRPQDADGSADQR